MSKIFDTRRPAVMRASQAGPTAPGERTPSCGSGCGAPRRRQATRASQPNTMCHVGGFCRAWADRTGGTQPLALRASPLPMCAHPWAGRRDLLQDLGREARHLAAQAVRGHAVIATRDRTDEQLDGFPGPACSASSPPARHRPAAW